MPDKRKVLLVRTIGNVPQVITKISIKDTTDKVRFRKKLYDIDISIPSYRQKNIVYYIVDLDKGQLTYTQAKKLIAPEMLEIILVRKLAKQLVAGLEAQPFFQNIILMILCIGLGLAFGYILGNHFPF